MKLVTLLATLLVGANFALAETPAAPATHEADAHAMNAPAEGAKKEEKKMDKKDEKKAEKKERKKK